jgi:cardiolipin synthase
MSAAHTTDTHGRELARRLGEPLMTGNRLELLQDGPQAFSAMYAAIEQARDHINLESYMVEAEGPGEEISRRLIERARAGVKVNFLFDSFGSIGTHATYFERLREAGVAVCEYNPIGRWRAWLTRALHWRDHRKLMVVDGRVGFIGGVNISTVYGSGSAPHLGAGAPEDAPPGWRDLHVRVEGPAVLRLQRLFIAHWRRHADCPLATALYFPPQCVAGGQVVGVAATDAGRRRNPYFRALLGAIDHARSSVLITTAYLVPPRRLLRALVRAAQRGVRVELLLPGVSDSWPALHAGRSHFSRLLRAGVRIHERHDTFLHAKACVIDGVWASIGSSNADWRSVLHNAEANLVVLDADFAAELETVFQADAAKARRVDAATWAARPTWHRWREQFARRFEFLL